MINSKIRELEILLLSKRKPLTLSERPELRQRLNFLLISCPNSGSSLKNLVQHWYLFSDWEPRTRKTGDKTHDMTAAQILVCSISYQPT